MELISKMIGELILDNDSVTLPGVGCLIAVRMPSTFSDKGFTINPPYRRISFSAGEGDDTLLTDLYAASNNVSPDTAEAVIRHFLLQMKEVLKDRKTVVFPGLGRLRATKENAFFFIQDEDLDICPDSFGLTPLSLKNHNTPYTQVPALTEIPARPAVPDTVPEEVKTSGSEEVRTSGPETAAEVEEAAVEVEEASAAVPGTNGGTAALKIIIWTIGILLLACALLRILGTVAPEFIDRFLYSEEELEILYH